MVKLCCIYIFPGSIPGPSSIHELFYLKVILRKTLPIATSITWEFQWDGTISLLYNFTMKVHTVPCRKTRFLLTMENLVQLCGLSRSKNDRYTRIGAQCCEYTGRSNAFFLFVCRHHYWEPYGEKNPNLLKSWGIKKGQLLAQCTMFLRLHHHPTAKKIQIC